MTTTPARSKQRRIAIVEDDVSIADGVRRALESHGFEVDWHPDGRSATEAFETSVPDLVLLDAGLPDVDGFSLCRWLREQHHDLPIVMVTARDADIDVIVGLDAGATDYVTKPFSINVLLARVRAHLRTVDVTDPQAVIVVGPLIVDPAAYTATVDGVALDLRRREFELLAYLAGSAGRVLTRERLLADVWDLHWSTSTKTLDMHILALRRKLGDRIDITNIRGVGYRLEAR